MSIKSTCISETFVKLLPLKALKMEQDIYTEINY